MTTDSKDSIQDYTFFLFYRGYNQPENRTIGDYQVKISGDEDSGFRAVVNNVSEQMFVQVFECEHATFEEVERQVLEHLDSQHPHEQRTDYRPDDR